jgi:dihydroorotate dehydrogenase (NAD+) catalytic subunit
VSRRGRSRPASGGPVVDLTTTVGSLELANPVMTASGTAGHGDELAAYVDLASLGAVVVKSLSADPWDGNPAPRVHETPAGMINRGTSVEDYARAAEMLVDAPEGVIAVEVNVSCPNHHDRNRMFAHSPTTTAEAIRAASVCGRPLWAKLSPNVSDLASIAAAAADAGAEAVTLVNTVLGMAIDPETRRPRLGGGGGGLSGPAIHPVAVRAVYDVHAALPDLPIVGVGGVAHGVDAVELMLAGASAVQVGTASFADPRSVERVRDEVEEWCRTHGVGSVRELIGDAHV